MRCSSTVNQLAVVVLLLLLESCCSCMGAVKPKRSPLEVGFVTFSSGSQGPFLLRHRQDFKMKAPGANNGTITVTNSANSGIKEPDVLPEAPPVADDAYRRIPSHTHTHRWVPGHVSHHSYIPAHVDHLYVPALLLAKMDNIVVHPSSYKTIYGGFGVGAGSGGAGAGHGFHVVLSFNNHQGLL